jgi:PilZ domain-containing protein
MIDSPWSKVVAMEEQRSTARSPTFLKGTIISAAGNTVEHVTVQNLSESGARLAVADGWSLPPEFLLDIPANQARHRAQIRWRLTAAVGVFFTEKARTPPPRGPDVTFRLIELEREIRSLRIENRELVKELSLLRTFGF